MAEQREIILKAALGRVAELGDLYDARTDTFCGTSILRKRPEKPVLQELDNHRSDIHTVISDDINSKLNILQVDGELKLSFLGGRCKISGAANYLNEEKKSARTASVTFVLNVETVVQKLQVSDEEFTAFLNENSFKEPTATHVVIQVEFGAAATLTLEAAVGKGEEKTKVAGNLTALFDFKALHIDGSAAVKVEEEQINNFNHFAFIVQADLLLDGKMPSSIDEALELMRRVPELVKKTNNGRGKPQRYLLLPVATLAKYLNVADFKADNLLKSINESIINDYITFFDDLAEYKGQLYDLQELFKHNRNRLPEEVIDQLVSFLADIKTTEQEFKSNLGTLLIEVRSGKRPITSLEAQLGDYKTNKLSFKKMQLFMNELLPMVQKIEFGEKMAEEGVILIERNENLQQKLFDHFKGEQIVLFSRESKDKDVHEQTCQLFYSLLKSQQKSDSNFFYIDADVSLKYQEKCPNGTLMKKYKESACICEDMLKEYEKKKNSNFAKSDSKQSNVNLPNRRVRLELPCPGACHKGVDLKWLCPHCDEFLEYDFTETFYCQCSKASVTSYEFKCSDPNHGLMFTKFEDDTLKRFLAKLRSKKELNILLLGETGVGKSQWVNAAANYLAYSSLEEASESDVRCLTPVSFTITDSNMQEQLMQVGESNTKQIFCNIPHGKRTIRFIDSTGLGDPEGVLTDTEHFNRLVDSVSLLEELHGICILVKAGETRNEKCFRYVIEEIMSRLPKTAADNIVFCFTHSAKFNYDAGNKLMFLKDCLRKLDINEEIVPFTESTIYTLDNEAFTYLSSLINPNIKTTEKQYKQFKQSWDQSRSETLRLLDHLQRHVEPVKASHVVGINDFRNLAFYSTLPLDLLELSCQVMIATAMHLFLKDFKEIERKWSSKVNDFSNSLSSKRSVLDIKTEMEMVHKGLCNKMTERLMNNVQPVNPSKDISCDIEVAFDEDMAYFAENLLQSFLNDPFQVIKKSNMEKFAAFKKQMAQTLFELLSKENSTPIQQLQQCGGLVTLEKIKEILSAKTIGGYIEESFVKELEALKMNLKGQLERYQSLVLTFKRGFALSYIQYLAELTTAAVDNERLQQDKAQFVPGAKIISSNGQITTADASLLTTPILDTWQLWVRKNLKLFKDMLCQYMDQQLLKPRSEVKFSG